VAVTRLIFGVFLIFHGVVHLLYAGDARGIYQLKPGMVWPEGSWLVSSIFGDAAARFVAMIGMALIAAGLAVAGTALFFEAPMWRPVALGAAAASVVAYLALWNGQLANLDGQGAIGVLISLGIILSAAVLRWPSIGF
jgi:hypothetical protein